MDLIPFSCNSTVTSHSSTAEFHNPSSVEGDSTSPKPATSTVAPMYHRQRQRRPQLKSDHSNITPLQLILPHPIHLILSLDKRAQEDLIDSSPLHPTPAKLDFIEDRIHQ